MTEQLAATHSGNTSHLTITRSAPPFPLFPRSPDTGPHLEMDLTSSQWLLLAPLVNKAQDIPKRGRPPRDQRAVLNAVLWILRTGARWSDLPTRYPPHQTCHRRYREWLGDGTLRACFRVLDEHLRPHLETTSSSLSGASSRSWIQTTAQVLATPLARAALERPPDTPAFAQLTVAPTERSSPSPYPHTHSSSHSLRPTRHKSSARRRTETP
jgi:transposase